ncbi:MAG: rod shape-determining protein MreC [Oscillospiraceae bacterium]|nr:rod shape-determining protein MreC [Oscillospiraceae bacterium]
MKHFFTNRVRVVLVAAVLLAAILAVISGVTNISLPKMFVQGVLTPARAGISYLTDQAERLYGYLFKYESLAAENEALKQELAQIQDAARTADAITRENERLRALLDLKDSDEKYRFMDGYIIAWSSNDWSNTITINRGTNHGVEQDMCAVTANGELVGLVSEVGPNYAVIKTVLDSSLEISATIAGAGYNGIVKGGYADESPDKLRMNYLPNTATIHIKDQVVTTGSTVYPRNLILGHVIDAGFDESGVAKFALLEPAADIGSLEQVFIVMDYNAG